GGGLDAGRGDGGTQGHSRSHVAGLPWLRLLIAWENQLFDVSVSISESALRVLARRKKVSAVTTRAIAAPTRSRSASPRLSRPRRGSERNFRVPSTGDHPVPGLPLP